MNLMLICVPEAVQRELEKHAEVLDFRLLAPRDVESGTRMLANPAGATLVIDGPSWGAEAESFLEDLRTRSGATFPHALVLVGADEDPLSFGRFEALATTVDFMEAPVDAHTLARRLRLAQQVLAFNERLSVPLKDPNADPTAAPVLTEARFFPLMDREIQRAERYLRPLSFLVLHIDGLGESGLESDVDNSRAMVRAVGERCSQVLRAEDCVGCIRETSLAALLPETGAPGAAQCAERLRCSFSDSPFQCGDGVEWSVTLSIGVATLSSETATLDELLAAALTACDEARADGGDAVSVSTPRGPLDL